MARVAFRVTSPRAVAQAAEKAGIAFRQGPCADTKLTELTPVASVKLQGLEIAMSETAQLLHLVLGGELTQLGGVEFSDLDKVEIVGLYPELRGRACRLARQGAVVGGQRAYALLHRASASPAGSVDRHERAKPDMSLLRRPDALVRHSSASSGPLRRNGCASSGSPIAGVSSRSTSTSSSIRSCR